MKLMIASDLHGSALYCRKLLNAFASEKADRLLLLGDLLYHGPRNDLPEGYDPKAVIALLNPLADRLFCVRGNCDAEVDQMVLEFPILADYAVFSWGNRLIYATHGHLFGEQNPPRLRSGDILLCGHTHVPRCTEHALFTYWNPGSVSIPKEDSVRGYMLLEEEAVCWKDLDGAVWMASGRTAPDFEGPAASAHGK